MSNKKSLGQYFTTNIELKEKLFQFILNNPEVILEPSIGRGDLIQYVINKVPNVIFDMFEIDETITVLKEIEKDKIIYCDFLKAPITKKYKTIIGNPPFVKIKKQKNLYIEFIEKCFHLLENDGELVFIVPADFFKLTSSIKLLKCMMLCGSFTHIFHPQNEKLFENATIDIVLFRYCKNDKIDNIVLYNDIPMSIINTNGMITFTNNEKNKENIETVLFKDYFDVYVGIVSGKDSVYKNEEFGNIQVLNGENKLESFIYIKTFPCDNNQINEYLLKNKKELIDRKIRKFNENNWFEWGALRNIKMIENNFGKECIYIHTLTRKNGVSFLGNVGYFGGSLMMLKPKKECNLLNVISYINSKTFKDNFMFSGRFKLGHRQLCNSYIPKEYL